MIFDLCNQLIMNVAILLIFLIYLFNLLNSKKRYANDKNKNK